MVENMVKALRQNFMQNGGILCRAIVNWMSSLNDCSIQAFKHLNIRSEIESKHASSFKFVYGILWGRSFNHKKADIIHLIIITIEYSIACHWWALWKKTTFWQCKPQIKIKRKWNKIKETQFHRPKFSLFYYRLHVDKIIRFANVNAIAICHMYGIVFYIMYVVIGWKGPQKKL